MCCTLIYLFIEDDQLRDDTCRGDAVMKKFYVSVFRRLTTTAAIAVPVINLCEEAVASAHSPDVKPT